MSSSAAPASNDQTDLSALQSLRVYKEVCHRVRTSLVAGKNEIVSPTTITRALVKESQGTNGEAPSAESPGGAMEHTVAEENCPFLEAAEGWTLEYSGGGCEVCLVVELLVANYCVLSCET